MTKAAPLGALAALGLGALALRPQIVGIGPLFPAIEADLHASHALVGLLGTIPVLGMGLFAPLAAVLAAHVGTRRGMGIGLALIAAFGLTRGVAPEIWSLVALTCGVGLGMGIANAMAPLVVRDLARPATGTAIYAGGIQVGSAVSAAVAVPLAAWFGGWRGALTAFSVVALVVALVWPLATRGGEPHVRPPSLLPRLPLRSRTAWLLAAAFGVLGSAYYGLNAWVPDAYGEAGWSERSAGLLLGAMNTTAIVASFVVPWAASRVGGRHAWLRGLSIIFFIGAAGLAGVPDAAFFFGPLAGIAQGGMFALVMLLPLGLERDRARVGALVAMMLGVGYTVAAFAPFVLGGVRDLTGSFDAVLWVCAAFLAVEVFVVRALPRT
ncbi:MAG: MFS transporter [Thermoleophilia bacterium]|nr:MFS transporter [Thermoleophilia bacterium]